METLDYFLWLCLAAYCISPLLFVFGKDADKPEPRGPVYGDGVLEPLDAIGYEMGTEPGE